MAGIFKTCMCFILAILLLTQPIFSVTSSTVDFCEKTQIDGDILLFEIEVTSNSNICGLSFEIKYIETQLKLINCSTGAILNDGIAKSNNSMVGKVILNYISMTPLKDNGSIIVIEFEIVSSDNRNIDIDCMITECIDKGCSDIAYTYSQQVIKNPKYVEITQNQDTYVPDNSTTDVLMGDVSTVTDDKNQTYPDDITANEDHTEKIPSDVTSFNNQENSITDNSSNNIDAFNTDVPSITNSGVFGEDEQNVLNDTDVEREQDMGNNSKVLLIGFGCIGVVMLMIIFVIIVKKYIIKKEKTR